MACRWLWADCLDLAISSWYCLWCAVHIPWLMPHVIAPSVSHDATPSSIISIHGSNSRHMICSVPCPFVLSFPSADGLCQVWLLGSGLDNFPVLFPTTKFNVAMARMLAWKCQLIWWLFHIEILKILLQGRYAAAHQPLQNMSKYFNEKIS